MIEYRAFVENKLRLHQACGIANIGEYPHLFDFQNALAAWAMRKGRAAIFADTGLGKTRMQLTWADAIHRETTADVLILSPLARGGRNFFFCSSAPYW